MKWKLLKFWFAKDDFDNDFGLVVEFEKGRKRKRNAVAFGYQRDPKVVSQKLRELADWIDEYIE